MPGRTLREIVRIVASRFVGMIVIFVLVVGAVGVATWWIPREYRSEAQLLAKPTKAVSPLESTSVSLREEVQLFVGYQREIIMSDYVLATAMMRLEGKKPLPPSKAETAPLYAAGDVDKYIAANGEKLRDVRKRVSVVTPAGRTSPSRGRSASAWIGRRSAPRLHGSGATRGSSPPSGHAR